MDLGLRGKRALVTGSTAGIGFAAAELLAREGASVVINGRDGGRVGAAVDRLKSTVAGADVRGIAA
ncbi:MAG TPA: SDR family NAD(P)-dependent oxidoreductase, partial [Polyangiaceae bacterium]